MSSPTKKKQKRLRALVSYGLLGCAVLALALYLGLRGRDRMQYQLPGLAEIDTAEIDSLELVTPDTVLTIHKEDGGWLLQPEGYKADPESIDAMMRMIGELEVTDLVSTSENFGLYDLDPEARIQIVASLAERVLRRFYIGKRSPTYNHTYVTLDGDTRVFQARGDFRRDFSKTKEELRELLVMAFDKQLAMEITARTPNEVIALTKTAVSVDSETQETEQKSQTAEDSGTEENTQAEETLVWTTATGTQWDPEQIDDLLQRMSHLECMKYLPDSTGLGEPILVVEVTADKLYTLSIYAYQEEAGHPARSSESGYAFYLSAWNRDNIVEVFEPQDD